MDLVFQNEYEDASEMRESMRITSEGFVGIGTATPEVQLHTTDLVIFEGLPTSTDVVNIIGIDSNNRLIRTDCACNSSSSINAENEITALKDRISVLEALVEKQLMNSIKNEASHSNMNLQMKSDTEIKLFQNVPNPFKSSTNIEYIIPQTVETAFLLFNNLNGQQVSKMSIDERGNGIYTLSKNDLNSGFYSYSLIADGKIIATKKNGPRGISLKEIRCFKATGH